MKDQLSRQALLKALLIATLVANYSADFMDARTSHTTNLSSEVVGGSVPAGVSITNPPPADSLPPAGVAHVIDQGKAKISLVPVGAATSDEGVPALAPQNPSAQAPPPAAIAGDLSPDVVSNGDGSRSELLTICNQSFYVHFREVSNGSDKLTEINIQPHTGEVSGFRPILYRAQGGFQLNLDRDDVKQGLDQTITALVHKHLARCEDQPPVVAGRPVESIRSGMQACRLDAHGEALSEIQASRCNLDQLNNLDLGDDESWMAHDRAASKIESVVRNNLKISIKNRLMSHDTAKVDEGEDLLNDTIDTVNDLTTEYNLDTNRMSHVVMELKSLDLGGRTYRDANDFSSQVKDAQNTLRQEYSEAVAATQTNPRDVYAQQRLQQVRNEMMSRQQMLQTQAQLYMTQGAYVQLLAASRMGYVTATDFSQFVQPFQAINSDLQIMSGLPQLQGPQFQSNFGTMIPQVPPSPLLGLNANAPNMLAYTGITPSPLLTQVAPTSTFTPAAFVSQPR